jgi:hypothetical protein
VSNMNWNGGRGERKENKATSVSEHKFGGSHKGNAGGKRGDAPVIGSHAKNGAVKGGSFPTEKMDDGDAC